ncbi:MAG: Pvc16 family protein [Gemmatimonadaceae bacterium]
MLSEFHGSLRTLVYDRGNIAADDVDVAFDAPIKAWVGARTRPTLSFFLFDIRENTDLRQTSPDTFRANGRGVHRLPPRRFDLRYLVSAVTNVVEDEHLLIWRTLGVIMKHPTIPPELLPESIRAVGIPVTGKLASADDAPRPLDVWTSLEGPARPSLVYIVTMPLDLELETSAPLVLTRTERFTRIAADVAPDVRTQIGGRVRDRKGELLTGARVSVDGRAGPHATTDAGGEFALAGLTPGPLTLRVQNATGATTLVPIEVPSDSYDVVAD